MPGNELYGPKGSYFEAYISPLVTQFSSALLLDGDISRASFIEGLRQDELDPSQQTTVIRILESERIIKPRFHGICDRFVDLRENMISPVLSRNDFYFAANRVFKETKIDLSGALIGQNQPGTKARKTANIVRDFNERIEKLQLQVKENIKKGETQENSGLYGAIGELIRLRSNYQRDNSGQLVTGNIRPAIGLDVPVAQRILRSGTIEIDKITDKRLLSFVKLLKEKGLEDIVVIGGCAKDHLLGNETAIISISIKSSFDDETRGRYSIPYNPADESQWSRAEAGLKVLAKTLGVLPEQFLLPQDNPNVAKFMGMPVVYIGPVKSGSLVIKQQIVDADTGEIYNSMSKASILNIAMDPDGKFYGQWTSIMDFLTGKVMMTGSAEDMSLEQIIRCVASAYEFNLDLSANDLTLMASRAKELLSLPLITEQRQLLQRIIDSHVVFITKRMGDKNAKKFIDCLDWLGLTKALSSTFDNPFNPAKAVLKARAIESGLRTTKSNDAVINEIRKIIGRVTGPAFTLGDADIIENELNALPMGEMDIHDIAESLDRLDLSILYIKQAIDRGNRSTFLPKSIAAHEFTTVIPFEGETRGQLDTDYARIGVLLYIYQALLAQVRPTSFPVATGNLNSTLLLKALQNGRLEDSDIDDEDTKAFLQFLRAHSLYHIAIIGGSFRDLLFGRKQNDFDLCVVVDELSHKDRGIAYNTQTEATEEIWRVSESMLNGLAEALNVNTSYILRAGNPKAPRFRGMPIEWFGPLKLFGEGVILRQGLGETKTRGMFSGYTSPANLKIALDANGNVYGRQGLLDYFLGRVTLAGDGNNYSLGAVLRTLRLHTAFGLRLEEGVEDMIKESMDGYISGATPIGAKDYTIARKQLANVYENAELQTPGSAPASRNEIDRKLEQLGVTKVVRLVKDNNEALNIKIDYSNISQENLPIFWDRLNATSDFTQWGLRFDMLAASSTSPEFCDQIKAGTVETVELHIGRHQSKEEVQADGSAVMQIPLERFREDGKGVTYCPTLFKTEKNGKVKYVFSGIDSNRDLYHYLSILKVLGFPVNKVSIVNPHDFNLRDHYGNTLKGAFTDTEFAFIGLNRLIMPLMERLQKEGWQKERLGLDPTYKYLIMKKDSKKIVFVYLDSIEGDACAQFIDELYSQGVRAYAFWGTAGGISPDQQYFDAVAPTIVFHSNDPHLNEVPQACISLPAQWKGPITDVHTVFDETKKMLLNSSGMGILAIEQELYDISGWLASRPDVKMSVYLNISEVLSWDGNIAEKYNALSQEDKKRIFDLRVSQRIDEILQNTALFKPDIK